MHIYKPMQGFLQPSIGEVQCIVNSYYFRLPMVNFLCKPNANDVGLLECAVGKIKAYSLPL